MRADAPGQDAGPETVASKGRVLGIPVAGGRSNKTPSKLVFITGSTRSRELVGEIQRLGWGRMLVESHFRPYPGEPWGFDNGAFGCWNNALQWDGREYLDRLYEALEYPEPPYLAVVPDKVADPDSLRFSLAWYERVGCYRTWHGRWYLAVQDGMQVQDVEPVVCFFDGLFLGGTKKWKRATAKQWVRLAHEHGKKAHYARCSVEEDLRHAERLGYDSADSTFLLWAKPRFYEFVALWEGRQRPQGELDLCAA